MESFYSDFNVSELLNSDNSEEEFDDLSVGRFELGERNRQIFDRLAFNDELLDDGSFILEGEITS